MQWSAAPYAGFSPTVSKSWLPVAPDYHKVNVETELREPLSVLNLYRKLLKLRKEHSALQQGSFLTHPSSTADVFAYRRESDSETITIVLNFSNEDRLISFGRGEVIFSTIESERSGKIHGRCGPTAVRRPCNSPLIPLRVGVLSVAVRMAGNHPDWGPAVLNSAVQPDGPRNHPA